MTSRLVTLALLVLLSHVSLVAMEAFSATANLVHLVETERELIPSLENYITQEEQRLKDIRKYIDEIRAKNTSRADEGLFYAGHPVNAYNLIKRWYKLAASTPNPDANAEISAAFSSLTLPSEDDFIGAVAALLRLQRTFALETDDIAQGRILGEQAAKPLAADDFIHLGTVALQNNDYGLAAEWLEKAATSGGERVQSWLALYKDLTRAYKAMGNIVKAAEYAGKAYELDKDNADLDLEHNQLQIQLERLAENSPEAEGITPTTWSRWLPSWKDSYERLCRGEDDATKDPSYAKDLVCKYRPGRIPWVVYKEEVLGWDPRVSIFYDIISDKHAEMVKAKAYPLLVRAAVGDPAKAFTTNDRVSKTAWLWDTDPEIRQLSERVEDITGLETEYRNPFSSAEPFQVVNYGIGGQYEPHVDYYESKEQLANVPDFIQGTGDRVSTFLLYLTDIKHGGATVFPRVKLRVPPTKNGAAFWFNAKLSGEFDKNTEHAGCPVLLGQKWVTNKWIRELGQEFRRPCALTPDAIDYS